MAGLPRALPDTTLTSHLGTQGTGSLGNVLEVTKFMGEEALGPLACGHSSFFGTKLCEILPDGITEETEAPPPYLGPG